MNEHKDQQTRPVPNALNHNGHWKRTRIAPTRTRSAVTSGRKLFVGDGDPNSAWSRRFSDLANQLIADLGGVDAISSTQFTLCKRAAGLGCECERYEARMSRDEEVDVDRYSRTASHLRRILEALGIERKPRDVTTLGDVLREGHRRDREEASPNG